MSVSAAEMYAFYVEAEKAVLQGKTVRHGDRLLTHEDLPEIRKGRAEWGSAMRAEVDGRRFRFSVATFNE